MSNKKPVEKSGVARCQRCFKYGHLTFECQNEPAYRYRPSRTMQYKQKLQLQIKASKAPKTTTLNPDYKRRVLDDGPSSDSEPQQQNQQGKLPKREQQGQPGAEKDQGGEPGQAADPSQSESSSSSDSSSSSSSDSSDSSSEESAPRKKKTQ